VLRYSYIAYIVLYRYENLLYYLDRDRELQLYTMNCNRKIA